MDLFEVYNENGVQQLTAMDATFYLKYKVDSKDMTLQRQTNGYPLILREFEFEAEYPIVALATKGIDKWVTLDELVRREGNKWLLVIRDSSSDYSIPADVRTIDSIVYIFDLRSTADPTNNFGLNLYDVNGKCTFSSNQAPFKVLDKFEVPSMYNVNYYPELNSSVQNRQLAIISNRYRSFYAHNDPSDAFDVVEYYSTAVGQVRVGYEDPNTSTFYDPWQNMDGSNDRKPQVIVVDVTNL